jgi:hypothetical protein
VIFFQNASNLLRLPRHSKCRSVMDSIVCRYGFGPGVGHGQLLLASQTPRTFPGPRPYVFAVATAGRAAMLSRLQDSLGSGSRVPDPNLQHQRRLQHFALCVDERWDAARGCEGDWLHWREDRYQCARNHPRSDYRPRPKCATIKRVCGESYCSMWCKAKGTMMRERFSSSMMPVAMASVSAVISVPIAPTQAQGVTGSAMSPSLATPLGRTRSAGHLDRRNRHPLAAPCQVCGPGIFHRRVAS